MSQSSTSVNQIQTRQKKRPPSQGFSSMHWVKKHEKIKMMNKYDGPGQYTMNQIKKHNKRDDCWMVLNGHVFDLTEYIPFHPGGDEILKAKGRDGTILFYQTHRWVNIEALIKNCWIGQVKDYKPPKINSKQTHKKKAVIKPNPNLKNKQEAISRSRQLLQKQQQFKPTQNQSDPNPLEIEKEENLEQLE
eukprot:89795_1